MTVRRDPYGPPLPERIVGSLFGLLAVLVGLRILAGLVQTLIMPLLLTALLSALLLWFLRRLYF